MSVPNITVTPEKFQLVLGVNNDITISITNVGFEPVLYRLLTTAPERYVVKHTKGIVKGNSATKITISLNPKKVLAAAQQQQQPSPIIKDDFRLEYAVQGADDVIEPRNGNVPQLIKEKKAANPSAVLKKMLRCHVLLDSADAATTITNPAASTVGSQDHRSAAQMEESTLKAKNLRAAAAGSNNTNAGAQGNVRGSAVARGGSGTAQRNKIVMILIALIAAGALWMLME